MTYLLKFETKTPRAKGLCFHPKRPWILCGLHTGVIQLWDYRACTLIDKFEEHEGPVRGIDFHNNQPIFVSGGDDYKIKVWNYKQRKCLFTLTGHLDYIRTTFFHHEQPWILSASDDQTIRIWNWQSRTMACVFAGHSHYVMCAQFHPKDDLVVSASLDQTIRVWDISGFRKKNSAPANFNAAEEQLRYLSGSASQGTTSISTGSTELFGTSDVIVKHVLEGHDRGVNWVTFHPTLPIIVSSSDDRQIRLWRMSESKAWTLDTLRGHFNNVSCVLFHPKQDLLLSDSEDKTIRVWDLTKRISVATFRRESDRFWVLASHPTLSIFAAGHDNGIVVFKLERERPAYTIHKSMLYYIKGKILRRLDFTSTKDVPVLQLKDGRGTARSIAYNHFENAVLVSSGPMFAESTSTSSSGSSTPVAQLYDLYVLPKVDGSTSTPADSCGGQGSCGVWTGRRKFAVLDSPGLISIRNFENDRIKKVELAGVDQIYPAGAGDILVRDATSVSLYSLLTFKVTAVLKNAKNIRHVVWSQNGQYVALFSKLFLYLCNRQLEVKANLHETVRIKSGSWGEQDVFVYTTSTHIKYSLLTGDHGIIRTLDLPIYITSVMDTNVFCLDRDCSTKCLPVDPTEYMFKLALINRRYDEVLHMVRNCNLVGQAIIGYLEQNGYPEIALHFVKDTRTRFSLAMDCGQLNIGLEAARELDDKACWQRLGQLALYQGNFNVLEMAYQRMKDFGKLTFLYLLTGSFEKLRKMLKIAEIRRDFSNQYQIALLLGDVKERIRILTGCGQTSLAYLTAATHGLSSDASALSAHHMSVTVGGDTEKLSPALPVIDPNARLLLPSPPVALDHSEVVRQANDNWPLLSRHKDFFETIMTTREMSRDYNKEESGPHVMLPVVSATALDADDVEVGIWGEDTNLDLDDKSAFVDTNRTDLNEDLTTANSEGGWEVEDELILLAEIVAVGGEKAAARDSSRDDRASTVSWGRSPSSFWLDNCSLAGEFVVTGHWQHAMNLLHQQVGVVNFLAYRSTFRSLWSASRLSLAAFQHMPTIFVHPQRNWRTLRSVSAGLPLIPFTLNSLLTRLQTAYQLTTKAQFEEAIETFRKILLSVPLLIVDNSSEETEAMSLISICKEYILGLQMELTRKALPKDSEQDQIRNAELACYFTHLRLELPHQILTLRTAVNVLFKIKNYRCAAVMARRLLSLAPLPEVAKHTRRLLEVCDANPTNAHELTYDPRNPFELCSATFVPIYRGQACVRDPLCNAAYLSEWKGRLCRITTATEIGFPCTGLSIVRPRPD